MITELHLSVVFKAIALNSEQKYFDLETCAEPSTTATPITTHSRNEFIFYQRNLQLSSSFQYASGSKNKLRPNMQ